MSNLVMRGNRVYCKHCGEFIKINTLMKASEFLDRAEKIKDNHKQCGAPKQTESAKG